MHHRLSGLSTYGLSGHRKGDEHPAYTSFAVWHPYLCEARTNDELFVFQCKSFVLSYIVGYKRLPGIS